MTQGTSTLTVTDDTFSTAVEKADGLVLVDFWAVWCAPCRIVGPIVDELAQSYAEKGVAVGKLDVDQNPRVTARFNVRSIPSILFFKNGQLVDTVVGAVPKPYLAKKIEEHL